MKQFLYVQTKPPTRTGQQLLRVRNSKRLFDLIMHAGAISRVELARRARLSPATVSALVEDLVYRELVEETGLEDTMQSGRKPMLLRVKPDSRQIPVVSLSQWGARYTLYDLSYQAIENAFVSHSSHRYGGWVDGSSLREPDAGDDYARLLNDVLSHHAPLYDREKAVAVCVTFPGLYHEKADVFISSAMHASFRGAHLEALSEQLGKTVFVGNSSMCMAYAERCACHGHKQVDDMIYLNVCEGVGAGILYCGAILSGCDCTAGEVGHMTIDYRGPSCSCGGHGCLEKYVGTTAILETVRRTMTNSPCAALLEMARDTLDNITLEMVGRAYALRETVIVEVIDDIAEKLFAGIASTVSLTGIRLVVLGGDIVQLGDAFLRKLQELARAYEAGTMMADIQMRYSNLSLRADSLGIAQYYMDKVFSIVSEDR